FDAVGDVDDVVCTRWDGSRNEIPKFSADRHERVNHRLKVLAHRDVVVVVRVDPSCDTDELWMRACDGCDRAKAVAVEVGGDDDGMAGLGVYVLDRIEIGWDELIKIPMEIIHIGRVVHNCRYEWR